MGGSILVDESLFDEEFIPERLVSREAQIKAIANSLKHTNCGRSKNLFIHGPPGVGKTLVTRWILKEHFDKNSVYVNCWRNMTSHTVIKDILQKLGTSSTERSPPASSSKCSRSNKRRSSASTSSTIWKRRTFSTTCGKTRAASS